jgi:hypothetical protein
MISTFGQLPLRRCVHHNTAAALLLLPSHLRLRAAPRARLGRAARGCARPAGRRRPGGRGQIRGLAARVVGPAEWGKGEPGKGVKAVRRRMRRQCAWPEPGGDAVTQDRDAVCVCRRVQVVYSEGASARQWIQDRDCAPPASSARLKLPNPQQVRLTVAAALTPSWCRRSRGPRCWWRCSRRPRLRGRGENESKRVVDSLNHSPATQLQARLGAGNRKHSRYRNFACVEAVVSLTIHGDAAAVLGACKWEGTAARGEAGVDMPRAATHQRRTQTQTPTPHQLQQECGIPHPDSSSIPSLINNCLVTIQQPRRPSPDTASLQQQAAHNR